MKSVVLTGVSGGMGYATATKLANEGYHVFGLDIKNPQKDIPNFTFIKTDLRGMSSIESAFLEVKKHTDEIDSIINMAGIFDLNSLIEMSEEDFTKIFDINVFGLYRLNKVFVPLLKNKGKVIMVSSELAPLDPLPFTGIYAMTKAVVEKYAYSLRMELQLLDKQVVVIRPGAVFTSMLDVSTTKVDDFTNNTNLYKTNAEKFKKITNDVESRKIEPSKIAKLVNKILKKKKPKYLYSINRNPLLKLLNILPQRLQNYIIKKILLPKKNP